MGQWGMDDASSNSVLWAVGQMKKEITTGNRDTFYTNTTADTYFSGATHGQFGVDATEVNTSNTASEAYGGGIAHTGWHIRTAGSGGRAGRVHYECLVAGGLNEEADSAAHPDEPILGSN